MADLIKWNRDPFEEFDQMLESFFPARRRPRQLSGNQDSNFMGFDMAVDIYEKDDNIVAEMNLPGVDPDKVSVEVEDGVLKISGDRKSENSEKDKEGNYLRREIRRGSFSRLVTLPDNADAESSSAFYKDGVLRVEMDKKLDTESQSKKIEVNASN